VYEICFYFGEFASALVLTLALIKHMFCRLESEVVVFFERHFLLIISLML